MKIITRVIAATAIYATGFSMHALAHSWPDKLIRVLAPFPPCGGTDIQARMLSTAFQKSTVQSLLVDNRTGASGLIATQLEVESPQDGNTILFTSGSL